jgi:capsular polysaccharide export protein
MAPAPRVFLFLQGPHGPFFWRLARARDAVQGSWRVGFNRGDRAFWPDRQSYVAQTDPLETWPDTVARLLDGRKVTDLVVYGDTRPIHATAIAQARARGITVHVFEEGYLRPYWVTYERGGANGHSPLMHTSRHRHAPRACGYLDMDCPMRPPAGAHAQHVLYGALYHGIVLFANRRYAAVRPHRSPVRTAGVPALPQAPGPDAVALDRPRASPPGASACRRLSPTTWRCCNWNMTRVSRPRSFCHA